MNTLQQIRTLLFTTITTVYALDPRSFEHLDVTLIADPLKEQFGDLSTNAALILAKTLNVTPRFIAQQLQDALHHPFILKTEIAGPGFLNIFLTTHAFEQLAQELCDNSRSFFYASSRLAKTELFTRICKRQIRQDLYI